VRELELPHVREKAHTLGEFARAERAAAHAADEIEQRLQEPPSCGTGTPEDSRNRVQ